MNKKLKNKQAPRQGAVLVLLAVILPVLILLCGIAINLSQAQLARTQLKVAADAAARAGGRNWTLTNDFDESRAAARLAASLNPVQGQPVQLSDADIEFGVSTRQGLGRFVFTPDNGGPLTSAVRVTANVTHNVLMRVTEDVPEFEYTVNSVASQVDRDIALVLDRSASMAKFVDEDFLFDTITALSQNPANGISNADYETAVSGFLIDDEPFRGTRLSRRFFRPSVLAQLQGDLLLYAQRFNTDWVTNRQAPPNSRWTALEDGLNSFFDELENSRGDEQISMNSFATRSSEDLALTFNINSARQIAPTLRQNGSTAIGLGLQAGIESLLVDSQRASAIPTIVIMSDGINRIDPSPVDTVTEIVRDNPQVVVHTVTFAIGDQEEMAEVARIGGGQHFHAADAEELIEAFRRLAEESFITILTE